MRHLFIALLASFCLAVPMTVQAEDPLPPCATDGDKDGDGVPDGQDSDEYDYDPSAQDGDGDGLPDCQD